MHYTAEFDYNVLRLQRINIHAQTNFLYIKKNMYIEYGSNMVVSNARGYNELKAITV